MANTYIAWTPSSAGERKKWTMSVWLKRSKTGVQSTIYNQYKDANYYNSYLTIQSDDQLNFVNYAESTTTNIKTTRKFRDTSAWYHIVLAVDTSEDSSDNRCKIYVNGVRETSFATNTRPSQNLEMFANQTQPQQWGVQRYASSSQGFFNGSMSYIAFIDGKAELPTIFGETDSTTGEWKIKTTITPSSAWGSNGYLILKDGNSLSDQSTNSNNFSLGGGTLTNTKDCPSNVCNIFNAITPSSNNLNCGGTRFTNNSGGWDMRNGTLGATSGKFYAEFKVTAAASSGDNVFGIIDIDQFDDYSKNCNFSRAYCYRSSGSKESNNSASSFGASFAANDIIGIAMDLDNNKVYASKNGTWQNSGNPASGSTGTGAMYSITNGYYYTFTDSSYDSGTDPVHDMNCGNGFFGTTAITTNSGNGYAGAEGASKFNYAVPSGFSALSTKGLNQ